MRLKEIFGICLIFWGANAIVKDEYSVIDSLRQALLKQGDDLNQDYLGKNGSVYNLVNVFKVFGDSVDNTFLFPPDQYLEVVNSVWLWARAQIEMRRINGLYMTFRQMQLEITEKNDIFLRQKWVDFAKTVLSDPNFSIPLALEHIADYIINQNLFVSAYQEASSQICNLRQSPQQLLYNLYNTIALTEIKGYTMMQFSLTLLKLYENGTFTEEMGQLKRQYATRTSETLRAVKTAMAFAPRDLWRCDPTVHKADVTYTELKQLFQGYIVNEVDLNDIATCKENCAYYSIAKQQGCFKDQYCSQQRRCNGKILNCQYIDSDMWICPSAKGSPRRYEYIEYENGQTFGQKGSCPARSTKVDSWWRWLFWHCSYCFCYCDDHNSSSDRYFNLRNVIADIENNKVVTGIRLRKVNKIIHIQIQEGILLPKGNIEPESISWKDIDDYTILDRNVKDGVDYHTVSWEKRAIDLDDLIPPPDHLLTGMRFKLLGAHINMEIYATPFNFTTGKLMKEKSRWYANDNTDAIESDSNEQLFVQGKRTEIILEKPDIPTRLQSRAVPDSRSNQYLHFAPTDLHKDAAQSTIPFLDIQAVEPKPPVPIAGAGIYHKGKEGSGGFIALKLITYNFSRHLKVDLPASEHVIGLNNEIDVS